MRSEKEINDGLKLIDSVLQRLEEQLLTKTLGSKEYLEIIKSISSFKAKKRIFEWIFERGEDFI